MKIKETFTLVDINRLTFARSGISFLSIPNFWMHKNKRLYCVITMIKATIIVRFKGKKILFHTSATFKNSATRSIRIRNFLYESSASRAFFLFMSKYFSKKIRIIKFIIFFTVTHEIFCVGSYTGRNDVILT